MANPALQDKILLRATADDRGSIKIRYLLIFITGNPGLIEYYRAFLTHLFSCLNAPPDSGVAAATASLSPPLIAFDVYGSSIPGFEFEDDAAKKAAIWRDRGLNHGAPFRLDEVIRAVEADVWKIAGQTVREYPGEEIKVVMMGHSLGSFITMEIIARHRRALENTQKSGARIVSGICLFPTVVDIGLSERGRILTTLSRIPSFQIIVPLLCNLVLCLIPTVLINAIVHRIDGLSGHCADATVAFLKSKHGVTQALCMGADEMNQITTDKWDEESWGAAEPSPSGVPRPKLFFYFGEKDHWVADHTREDLIKTRGRVGTDTQDMWKPKMEIDSNGIPHGFCIAHSLPIAEKVREYINEIVELERLAATPANGRAGKL